MFLPVQNKPESNGDHLNEIVEMHDLITKNLADELKVLALDIENSGWHRRGSNAPEHVSASFYTCLLPNYNSTIYHILDHAWEQYHNMKEPNFTFIEPYEIKLYVLGDKFGLHNDIRTSNDGAVERKINLIIQLSDEEEYEGGDLYIGKDKCTKKFGSGIFFPARYLHKVTEITSGERFSLIGHSWGPTTK